MVTTSGTCRKRSRRLLVLILSASVVACSTPCTQESSAAFSSETTASPVDPTSDLAKQRYRLEQALGARCSDNGRFEFLLVEGSCHGMLPAHIAWFIRNIPASHHYLTKAIRDAATGSPQNYISVPGHGRRADFAVIMDSLDGMWLRSFEGSDPDVTYYLVHGPACYGDCIAQRSPLTFYRLYKTIRNSRVEDATVQFQIPPPMTAEEQKKYAPLVSEEQEASDGDISPDVNHLARKPIVRWLLMRPRQAITMRPALTHPIRDTISAMRTSASRGGMERRFVMACVSPTQCGNRRKTRSGCPIMNKTRS